MCGKSFSVFPSRVPVRVFCSRRCKNKYHSAFLVGKNNTRRKRRVLTCETCGRHFEVHPYLADKRRYCSYKCSGVSIRGKIRSDNKGLTILSKKIRGSFNYRQWRSDVFFRDDFTCGRCNTRGGPLHAHHVKRFSEIIAEYKIQTLKQALECAELWDLNNGTTLCVRCHQTPRKEGRTRRRNND